MCKQWGTQSNKTLNKNQNLLKLFPKKRGYNDWTQKKVHLNNNRLLGKD